jgi:hypothetical protein
MPRKRDIETHMYDFAELAREYHDIEMNYAVFEIDTGNQSNQVNSRAKVDHSIFRENLR